MHWVLQNIMGLIHPHYISNLLLSVLFFGLKTMEPVCDVIFENCELELVERMGAAYFSWLHYSHKKSKATQNIFYGIAYVVVCLCQLVLLPEPVYRGPEHITYFTGIENLQNEMDKDNRITWIIEFYSAWSPNCVNFAPIFSELSAKYSLPNLKFGKVDITRFADAADKFKVNNSVTSKQLPTVIQFENGKEVRRKPFVNERGQVSKFVFTMENVCSGFQLNEMYLQCQKNLKGKKSNSKTVEEQKKDD
ncbi:DgyrCDS5969 [Dimorphilus gyrociliatus]|uniref:DgyrCDS5969 n=1 Tax=Dimorphilus gyrociliatus TaxID=2664684 RepID=A0A7I8VRE8_9ANNE|nr:DgyrCDS5969 [Dimorphilus gyrociliatus]